MTTKKPVTEHKRAKADARYPAECNTGTGSASVLLQCETTRFVLADNSAEVRYTINNLERLWQVMRTIPYFILNKH